MRMSTLISDCVFLAMLKNIPVRFASRSCGVTFWEQNSNCSGRPSELLLKYFVICKTNCPFCVWFTQALQEEASRKRWWNLLFFELNKYLPHFMTVTGHGQNQFNDIQPHKQHSDSSHYCTSESILLKIFVVEHRRTPPYPQVLSFSVLFLF